MRHCEYPLCREDGGIQKTGKSMVVNAARPMADSDTVDELINFSYGAVVTPFRRR